MGAIIARKTGCVVMCGRESSERVPCSRRIYPDALERAVEDEEAYHFNDIGRWCLNTAKCDSPDDIDKLLRGVTDLGISHKHPMTEKWSKR